MCKIRCPYVQFLTEIVRQASLCDIALVPLESISFQKFESVNQLIQQPLNYSEVRHSYSSCSETLRGIRALLLSRIGLRLFFQQLSRRVRVRPTLHFKRSEWQVECKLGQLLIPQNICERRGLLQVSLLVGKFYPLESRWCLKTETHYIYIIGESFTSHLPSGIAPLSAKNTHKSKIDSVFLVPIQRNFPLHFTSAVVDNSANLPLCLLTWEWDDGHDIWPMKLIWQLNIISDCGASWQIACYDRTHCFTKTEAGDVFSVHVASVDWRLWQFTGVSQLSLGTSLKG